MIAHNSIHLNFSSLVRTINIIKIISHQHDAAECNKMITKTQRLKRGERKKKNEYELLDLMVKWKVKLKMHKAPEVRCNVLQQPIFYFVKMHGKLNSLWLKNTLNESLRPNSLLEKNLQCFEKYGFVCATESVERRVKNISWTNIKTNSKRWLVNVNTSHSNCTFHLMMISLNKCFAFERVWW